MKASRKPLGIVERAKKSFVGKIVCRAMGEETGAVMMEYVIVAVLIAAAVAAGDEDQHPFPPCGTYCSMPVSENETEP